MAWKVCSVVARVARVAGRRVQGAKALDRRARTTAQIWSSTIRPCYRWSVNPMRKRAGRDPVVMGATITVLEGSPRPAEPAVRRGDLSRPAESELLRRP
jgi:hypothetical protein